MVDQKGNLLDGDEILYVIAKEAVRARKLQGGVVGTLMSNLGLELALKKLGLDFKRAKVGDRYVIEMMQQLGWQLGGEASGHIICLNMATTGDGIVAALQVLAIMKENGKALHELTADLTKFPQITLNVELTTNDNLLEKPVLKKAVADAQTQLADKGRVLLRPSGTEPVMRVMVEGQNDNQVRKIAERLATLVSDLAAG